MIDSSDIYGHKFRVIKCRAVVAHFHFYFPSIFEYLAHLPPPPTSSALKSGSTSIFDFVIVSHSLAGPTDRF